MNKKRNLDQPIVSTGPNVKIPRVKKIIPKDNSVIYHASQSMPHTTSGYAIRTHGLVSSLLKHEVDVNTILRFKLST